MVFSATFNRDVSVISWWSVLLVKEIGVPRENEILSIKIRNKQSFSPL
jgi:hypothetical protein